MSTSIIPGQTTWKLSERDGQRTYTIKFIVMGATTDGPFNARNTPGLPRAGDVWRFDGDYDPWAFCKNEADVTPHKNEEGRPNRFFACEYTFQTPAPTGRGDQRPTQDSHDGGVQDPLQEPPKISGTFSKFQEQGLVDRFGLAILNSSHEPFLGQNNQWDDMRPTVKIEQNLARIDLPLIVRLRNAVNDAPLWGCPRRCVKLASVSWEKRWYGQGSFYYSRTLDFEINFSTWDRDITDEGTKVLNGKWADDKTWVTLPVGIDPDTSEPIYPDEANPSDFMRAIDRKGNACKVVLDGHGVPFNPDPLDIVTTCSQCPNGSPTRWILRGWGSLDEDGVEDAIVLTSSGPCEWDGTTNDISAAIVILQYNVGLGFGITVSGIGGDGTAYVQDPTQTWQCLRPNAFVKLLGEGPNSLAIIPDGENVAGQIHVEKYPEDDLTLLGIPAIL